MHHRTHRKLIAPASIPRKPILLKAALLVLLSLIRLPNYEAAVAQPVSFGSSDDPAEQVRRLWWQPATALEAAAGPSLIGPQWRTGAALGASANIGTVAARVNVTARAGIYGVFDEDLNEAYDALRAVQYVRYAAPSQRFYARIGPTRRVTLGTGHLVNFHRSDVAWDDRLVGAEFQWRTPIVQVTGFADDLLLNGLTGGRVAVTPSFLPLGTVGRSASVGFSYVTDLSTRRNAATDVSAYSVDASVDLLRSGDIVLSPFASYASYRRFGQGLGVGADVWSDNFVDLARFRLRFALLYNGDQFVPGYLGAFYNVNNLRDRILVSADTSSSAGQERVAGTTLAEAVGGNDFVTELRLLLFERFEFWYYFRRHYGSQPLSEHHLRLFLRAQQRLNLEVGIDRGGLRGFLSLFRDLGDETALVFNMEYQIRGPLWAHVRSRYTYERLGSGPDGGARFLAQRRFEPFLGFRYAF